MDTHGLSIDKDSPRPRFSDNRPSDRGKRNRENSTRDNNLGDTDSSGRSVKKNRTGRPKSNLAVASPKVVNPRRIHQTSDTRADTPREAKRRRKNISRLAEPARRQKQTSRLPKIKTP